jgi:GT2 family glycosyltransferase
LPDHAVIGYVHGGWVRAEFMASVMGVTRDLGDRLDAVIEIGSGPNVSRARNMLAGEFLAGQRAPWLFMVDTDMVLAPDAVSRLIAAADPLERPLVGALCYGQDPSGGDPLPVLYELVEEAGQPVFARLVSWPEDSCVRVAATGAACLLMHRTALERVAAASGDKAAPWFRESILGGALTGEDLTFCLRAGAAGIPVHVHTGVQAGHVKPVMLGKVT